MSGHAISWSLTTDIVTVASELLRTDWIPVKVEERISCEQVENYDGKGVMLQKKDT